MKGFTRTETRFSLCGLHCGLCTMGGYTTNFTVIALEPPHR